MPAVGGELEAYRSLDPLLRAGIQFVGTVLVAMVVLGLLQNFGTQAVAKARRSPVISICLGLPSLLVVAGLAGTGYLIVDTSVGTFFGIPLVILGVTVLPAAIAIGFTTLGRNAAAMVGRDRLWTGILVGGLVHGIAGLVFPATVTVAALAGALGMGASVRVLVGGVGAARPDDRTVPPANKI
ncbi:hypothetical protein A6E15_09250 [Natrinema saccharevitans]|uniref:Uncharacterized protein n=1 Tax=Natrinema saccharevitans TaxID=301967 RepID=A0A1S8B1J6_9EURY|nr:hypothetical protein [Natrinema saccharevitans]OLZ42681.1 hypothetical protein A6E15_09250 [Natrinema saccharevitans]